MSSSLNNRCGPPHAMEELTWRRLVDFHGIDRAARIVRGQDPETNEDLAKWRSLGARGRSARR